MGSMLRIAAVAGLAAAWGCFSAPSADVLFACDPDDAPQCPPEYACESDGCCHRKGSDVDASRGACNSGPTSGFDPTASATEGTTSFETDTDTDGGSSSSGTGEGSSAAQDTGATATDAGSEDTGGATEST